MKKIAIIGAGSWGTALSIVLSRARAPHRLALWVFEQEVADSLRARCINEVFLPGVEVPRDLQITQDWREAIHDADIVLGVMPSSHARRMYTAMLPHLSRQAIIVSATKGLEPETLLRMSQVIEQVVSPKFAPSNRRSFRPFLRARSGSRRSHCDRDRFFEQRIRVRSPSRILRPHAASLFQ